MIAIKTTMEYMPSDCDYCRWFGTRPHPYKGWTDICELMGHCMDDDQPEEWIYSGDSRPKACPLVEIAEQTEPQKSCSTCGYSPQTPSCDTCYGYSNWWVLEDEPSSSEIPNNCEDKQTEGVWNAGYKTGYDKGYKDAQKVKDSQDLVKDLVKAFCEDGTWLERQGVYTLTLAEAKQRAVDIIESVTQTETQNSNFTFEKADERCKGCKHYKLTCGLFSEICKYEPKTEPQQVTSKLADTVIPTDTERGTWDYKGSGKWEQTEPMIYPQVDGITPSVIQKVGYATDSVTGEILGMTLDTDCSWK